MIDWSQLVEQAHAYRAGKVLYYALRLAREVVGAGVPSSALAELRATFDRLPLEDRRITGIMRRAILSEHQDQSTASRAQRELCVRLLTTDGASDGVEGAARLVDRRASHARGVVGVTYDNSSSDGVGSQLQRIYGLYALSRALDVKYVHTPLGRVGYQGLMPLLTGRTEPDFSARYNALFSLPSDEFDLESCERVRIHTLTQRVVERYRERAAATGRSILLEACIPFGYTDRVPSVCEVLRTVSPYRGYSPSGPIRVCVHVRRGDNSVSGRSDQGDRLLPNSYYLRVCGTLIEALREHGTPFVIRLHSEVPPRPYTLYPGNPGIYFELDQPGTIDPADLGLEEFDALPNLQPVLNVEPQEVLDDFATADVLILSRSSLGYVAGMLNPHGLIVYAPWWHPPLPDWLVADEHGNLDAVEVAARIATHVRDRR